MWVAGSASPLIWRSGRRPVSLPAAASLSPGPDTAAARRAGSARGPRGRGADRRRAVAARLVSAGPCARRASGQSSSTFTAMAAISAIAPTASNALPAKAMALLMLEYRGYGGNPGVPSEAGLCRGCRGGAAISSRLRAIAAAPARAVRRVARAPVSRCGLATQRMTSRRSSSNRRYTSVAAGRAISLSVCARPRGWCADRFDSLSRIGEVKAPILILHGERDGSCPCSFGGRCSLPHRSRKRAGLSPRGRA